MIIRPLLYAAAFAALTACGTASAPDGMGVVRVQLTDAPFPFDSVAKVEVHVVRVDARLQDADDDDAAADVDDDDADGWVVLARPDKVFELLALQGGKLADLGSATIAAGTYNGLRLIIDASKSSITLKNGKKLTGASSPGVQFPSADRSGLKVRLAEGIDVTAANVSVLVIDFDVGESFVMRGNSITQNGLLFKPVLSATVK
ncbi:MAG TPA: DUF4382 domain-containing protein [Gemmatimonadaceae bacterium]|nr:DUF4382 domain-containing protein [Gemmatimonadaceae bacterium]